MVFLKSRKGDREGRTLGGEEQCSRVMLESNTSRFGCGRGKGKDGSDAQRLID